MVLIRLGCSSLNHDLHRKNITDSPRCICNAAETCSHFLLKCPLYVNQRHHHLNGIPCALTLNNLLYGDEHLTFEQNKNIFMCVKRYIASTTLSLTTLSLTTLSYNGLYITSTVYSYHNAVLLFNSLTWYAVDLMITVSCMGCPALQHSITE